MGHIFHHELSLNKKNLLNIDLYTVMNTRTYLWKKTQTLSCKTE